MNDDTYQSIGNNGYNSSLSKTASSNKDSNDTQQLIQQRRKSTIYHKVSSFNFRRECPVISVFLLYTFLVFLFAGIGGILFHVCEYEHENTQILQKQQLYDDLINVLDEQSQLKLDHLLEMCEVPRTLNQNRWKLPRSIFFAFTTASTIGYGYTTPVTPMGKACTFLYGFPAIIIFGLAMIQIGHAIVNRIDKGASYTYLGQLCCKRCCKCICSYFKLIFCRNCSIELQRTVYVFVILTIVICFSAWVMEDIENKWSFNDGMYFMWISISTIGYGDIEPSVIQSSYWANGLVWLGLSLTAILIGSSQDYFQIKVKYWRAERMRNNYNNNDKKQIMMSDIDPMLKIHEPLKGNPAKTTMISPSDQ